MPTKKITKALIEIRQQEKANQEVEQFLATYIRKAKIQGINTTTKDFQDKVETMKNKMLGIKPQRQSQGGSGLRGMLEDLDNLETLKDTITTELDNLETIKSALGNELRSVKIKVNEIENKQTDWEEIINKPEIILQDEFYQEQIKTEEKQKESFNLFQLLRDEIGNVRDYFEQIIKGISRDIIQIRNRKISHNELLGITKDQHHKEQHTLESHLASELMTQLKRLVNGGYVDDLHRHKEMIAREQGKVFASIGRTTLSTEILNSLIDGTETVFAVSYEPIFVDADGQLMHDGIGNGYIYANGTITMENPPQSILISFYNS